MKKTLIIIVVIGVTALTAYLAITKHLSEERAAKLDRALMEAEGRIMQLESDIESARRTLAELINTREAPRSSAPGSSNTAKEAGTAAAVPVAGTSGSLVRYVAFATGSAGLTNLVRIEGTSSVHDWQVEGHLIGGSAEFGAGFPSEPGTQPRPGSVDAKATVFIPVRSLKSVEKSGQPYSDKMDEIMYEKLLEPTNKRITYTLTSLMVKEQPGKTDAPLVHEATGNLCVGGETNAVTMPVAIIAAPNGRIQISGSIKVKMTDFKMTPPAPAVAGGAITTGDDVTLKFVWWAKKAEPLAAK